MHIINNYAYVAMAVVLKHLVCLQSKILSEIKEQRLANFPVH